MDLKKEQKLVIFSTTFAHSAKTAAIQAAQAGEFVQNNDHSQNLCFCRRVARFYVIA